MRVMNFYSPTLDEGYENARELTYEVSDESDLDAYAMYAAIQLFHDEEAFDDTVTSVDIVLVEDGLELARYEVQVNHDPTFTPERIN